MHSAASTIPRQEDRIFRGRGRVLPSESARAPAASGRGMHSAASTIPPPSLQHRKEARQCTVSLFYNPAGAVEKPIALSISIVHFASAGFKRPVWGKPLLIIRHLKVILPPENIPTQTFHPTSHPYYYPSTVADYTSHLAIPRMFFLPKRHLPQNTMQASRPPLHFRR